jgi:transposase, IS5 family
MRLAERSDWDSVDKQTAAYYAEERRAGIAGRLMVGLQVLKRRLALSDEAVCERCVHDPYFRYFCEEVYFRPARFADRGLLSGAGA